MSPFADSEILGYTSWTRDADRDLGRTGTCPPADHPRRLRSPVKGFHLKYAIISDIHGNLHALEAVLEEIDRIGVDVRCCLGDIVGYGAFPNECVELVQGLGFHNVAGNHDFAVLNKISTENFNKVAKISTEWTRESLTQSSLDFLDGIDLVEEMGEVTLVHGTRYSPELFDYIQSSYEASLSLEHTSGKVCFIGHSHVPISFLKDPFVTYSTEQEIQIPETGQALVNVGSVGQPRDKNPRACFATYDDEAQTVHLHRVSYDIDGAIEGIRDRGLPTMLGDRLRFGR